MKNLVAKMLLALVVVSGLSAAGMAKAGSSAVPYESIVKYFTVAPYGETNRVLNLYAGETVYIKVTGDGHSDLDLYVSDSWDDLIVKDERTTTDGYVTFKVAETGEYYVDIANNGGSYNTFKYEVTVY
jgi:hypothetical protein